MSIAFNTLLTDKHWRADLGGWDCSALRIPGATVTDLLHNGQPLDKATYKASEKHRRIRWHLPHEPLDQVVVEIELGRRLFSGVSTSAISALSAIIVALITGYFSVRTPAPAPHSEIDAFVRWRVSGELDFADTDQHQRSARLLLSPPSWQLLPGNIFYVEFCEGPESTDAADRSIVVENKGYASQTIRVRDYLPYAEDHKIFIPQKIPIRKTTSVYQPAQTP